MFQFYRRIFHLQTQKDQREFIAGRITGIKPKRYYLEHFAVLVEYYNANKMPSKTVPLTAQKNVCSAFFRWAIDVSKNKLDQPTSFDPHFTVRMSGPRVHVGSCAVSIAALIVEWILDYASIYLCDPTHPRVLIPAASRKIIYAANRSHRNRTIHAFVAVFQKSVENRRPTVSHQNAQAHAICTLRQMRSIL